MAATAFAQCAVVARSGSRLGAAMMASHPRIGPDTRATAVRRVLMIAYHFPPLAGSSGIQRTLRFVQQLPGFGWQPLVLTIHPRAYERTSTDLLEDVPPGTVVRRAFGLDTARHLAIAGRYVGSWARPDRWRTWRYDALRQGLALIQEWRPCVLWSTYPIPTAHEIALELKRRSGLPWVADFRDPMAQDGYPPDPQTWAAFKRIETDTIGAAEASVFTTPGAARTYARRYPQRADRIIAIENGYDEESFTSAQGLPETMAPLNPGAVTLLHSGIVYPSERDPTALLEAVARMARAGTVSSDSLRLRFRASVHDDLLHKIARRAGVDGFIETEPPVPYREALHEMHRADALLVLQSAGCNEQIPAKVYEYLRADRPILCLTDAAGDTAGVLRDAGLDAIAPLDDPAAIALALESFLKQLRDGSARRPDPAAVRRASRLHRSEELVVLLNRLCPLPEEPKA